MKRLIFSIVFISAFTLSLFAQKSEVRNLPHFDKIRVTNQVNVYLTQGETPSAKIVVSGIELGDVITEVNGKTLEITLKRGVYKDISAEVYLTYNELRDIHARASGRLSFQSVLTGDKVVMNATTNGEINVDVDLKTCDVSAGQGGSVRIGGKLGSYEARITTAGILSASELVADSAFVTVHSKGIAKVAANELLDANVRTGGSLTLSGNPVNKRIKTGLGATILEQ
jgi:hypothetical protein